MLAQARGGKEEKQDEGCGRGDCAAHPPKAHQAEYFKEKHKKSHLTCLLNVFVWQVRGGEEEEQGEGGGGRDGAAHPPRLCAGRARGLRHRVLPVAQRLREGGRRAAGGLPLSLACFSRCFPSCVKVVAELQLGCNSMRRAPMDAFLHVKGFRLAVQGGRCTEQLHFMLPYLLVTIAGRRKPRSLFGCSGVMKCLQICSKTLCRDLEHTASFMAQLAGKWGAVQPFLGLWNDTDV